MFAFFGLPAFGEDNVVDPQLERHCRRLLGHDRFLCGNDMICGWAGSLACADGINLVCGTGSIGYGERQGRAARVGGWGEVFSDEASAYWIAIQGLNAFTRMSDGRMPKGPLHAGVSASARARRRSRHLRESDGRERLERDGIAGLAPIVAEAVAAGDPAAIAIHDLAADELAAMAERCARRSASRRTSRSLVLVGRCADQRRVGARAARSPAARSGPIDW